MTNIQNIEEHMEYMEKYGHDLDLKLKQECRKNMKKIIQEKNL